MESRLDELSTVVSRSVVMDSIATLNSAIKELTP
jgi:hypothetical protein